MKMIWCIMLAALAGLVLTACWPEKEVPFCGGVVTDKTDHSAPKVIESKEITELNVSFWLDDEKNRGRRWELWAGRNSSGGVSVSLQGEMQGQAQTDTALLADMQSIIDRFELAKLNGIDRVTAGLPPQFSPVRLRVDYASGECLYFQRNGDPKAEWSKAMLDAFLKVLDKNR